VEFTTRYASGSRLAMWEIGRRDVPYTAMEVPIKANVAVDPAVEVDVMYGYAQLRLLLSSKCLDKEW